MDLFAVLVLPVLALLCIAVDVTVFFVLVRLLRRVWASRWILAFDAAGAQLVDCALRAFQARVASPGAKVKERAALAAILVILLLVRTLLAAMRYGIAAVAVGG